MDKLNSIELFAGCGGLVDGFEKTNKYNLLAAVDWLKPQTKVLINRLETKYCDVEAKQKVLTFDIQRTDELINGWKNDDKYGNNNGLDSLINESVDIISGGPPCQAYSIAGRIRDENGMKGDYRNFLFESYIRIVDYYRPKIIVFENVEGMLSSMPNGVLITDLIKKGFNEIGYEIIDDLRANALFNLVDFGVPQNRKRVILIGIRKDFGDINYQNILEEFYMDFKSNNYVDIKKTVRDAIFDLPPLFPLDNIQKRQSHINNSNINGHYSRFHNERDQQIFYELAKDIEEGTEKYNSTQSLIDLYYEKTGKKTNVHKYNVLKWDEPSNTIPAHLKKDGLRHIHPDSSQKRTISVREAARIQTFDDDFEFNVGMGASFEMIGNAVPPLFAYKVACSVYDLYYDVIKIEKELY